MQITSTTATDRNAPSQPASYQPSVPITVYRQLSAELQHTKERLSTVQIENEALISQNQSLRQEFTAIATAHQQIQNLVAKSSTEIQEVSQRSSQRVQTLLAPSVVQAPVQPIAQQPQIKLEPTRSPILPFEIPAVQEAPRNSHNPQAKPNPTESPKLYTEEPALSISSETKDLDSGLSGVWLTFTVICIVLISFGAGYLLMKPFANRN
jgi:FtsZ-binding cell division protein ZapB